MKEVQTRRGPFAERPYYSDEEIESLCIDELRVVNLLPDKPEPIRIDRFIEKRFQVVPEYENVGEGILGLTEFGSTGVKAIVISRSLEDQSTEVAERQIRTTLAHEAGHGLLHAHLFTIGMSRPLFVDLTDADRPKVLCRGKIDGSKPYYYNGEWWEFQANRAMGALLLPRHLVNMAAERYFIPQGSMGGKCLDHTQHEDAARLLSSVFNVNPAVARIRLDTLYPEAGSGQMQL